MDRNPTWLLADLDSPRDVFRHLGPNWFASVMGTGIVANAAALLPVRVPGLHTLALVFWVLAATMLVALLVATAVHWTRHGDNARAHALNPTMAPFYGAPPMALLTVGAGAGLIGHDLIGDYLALRVDATLWVLGTLTGLAASAAVPVLMFTRHDLAIEKTFATWLMPVVPPMVSAATGAALIEHLPAGQWQLSMLIACYALFGLSLLASVVTITLVWGRLAWHKTGPAQTVPTLWIVLGPLGQSITAAGLLAAAAGGVISDPYATALKAMGVVYGVPVWGFAALWLGIALTITLRTARDRLPFSLTWWSFTFPLGTFVTGTSELARQTGATSMEGISVALYALLIGGWLLAGTNTLRQAVRGRIFLPPEPAPAR